jgi:hypothetical protein
MFPMCWTLSHRTTWEAPSKHGPTLTRTTADRIEIHELLPDKIWTYSLLRQFSESGDQNAMLAVLGWATRGGVGLVACDEEAPAGFDPMDGVSVLDRAVAPPAAVVNKRALAAVSWIENFNPLADAKHKAFGESANLVVMELGHVNTLRGRTAGEALAREAAEAAVPWISKHPLDVIGLLCPRKVVKMIEKLTSERGGAVEVERAADIGRVGHLKGYHVTRVKKIPV